MAWAHVAARGTGASGGGTSLGANPSANIVSGVKCFVRVTSWNDQATNGPSNDHVSMADTAGNTWTKVGEVTYSATMATDGGITVSLWVCEVTTTITTSDTITCTFVNSRGFPTISFSEFTSDGVLVVGVATAGGNTSATSVSLSGLASAEYLWLAVTGYRRTAGDTETLDGTFANDVAVFDTGTGSNSNRTKQWGEYRVFTGTAQTVTGNNSTAGNWAMLLVAISEAPPPPPQAMLRIYDGADWVAYQLVSPS